MVVSVFFLYLWGCNGCQMAFGGHVLLIDGAGVRRPASCVCALWPVCSAHSQVQLVCVFLSIRDDSLRYEKE